VFLGRLACHGVVGPPAADHCFAQARRIDLNAASVADLMTLPGIGRTRAVAVVLHRVRHGRFRSLDDLVRVDGLGPATVASLRPYLLDPEQGDR